MRNIILVFLPWFNANIFTYIVARYFCFLSIFITYYLSQNKILGSLLKTLQLKYARDRISKEKSESAWKKNEHDSEIKMNFVISFGEGEFFSVV